MGMRRGKALFAGATALAGVIAVGGMALANGRQERLKAEMSGQNEVPVADPDGDGKARVEFTVDGSQLCFRVRFDDTGTPNRGHIHVGAAGVNGAIVLPLFELIGMPADARNEDLEEGHLEGCVTADPALLAQIEANPAGYYVNLHNTRFPGGAIRGQLED
jgi:hypothetical protein